MSNINCILKQARDQDWCKHMIIGTVYSKSDAKYEGTPVFWTPENIEHDILDLGGKHSLGLYKGITEEDPVPDMLLMVHLTPLFLAGMVKMIRFKDPLNGDTCEATLTIIFKKQDDAVFYMYLDELQSLFNAAARDILQLEGAGNAEGKIKKRITSFDDQVRNFLEEIRENETEYVKDEEINVKNDLKTLKAKIIVIGAPAVGKTSLILRFTSNAFTRTYLPTLGVQLSQKRVPYGNYMVELSIWDLAGHEKFNVLLSHYYKGSEAEIIVFDLTRPDTYRGVEKWSKDIQKNLGRAPVGIVIGNKNDLEEQRSISMEEIQTLQDELGLKCFETSALKGRHVEEAFLEIARILVERFEKKFKEYERDLEKNS